MPTSARTNLSGEYSSGTNSGSMTLAMNSTVTSGTPRTISMNITENSRTAGMRERRPSASKMPIGSEQTMPTEATTMVTRMPPHSEVSTGGNPAARQPVSRMNEDTGSTTKKYTEPRSRRGASSHSIQTTPSASMAKKTSTRQRCGIG